jgi:hypothetical protein
VKLTRFPTIFAVILLFGTYLLFSAGCASGNIIWLSYPEAAVTENAPPESHAATVCIVDFHNKRGRTAIGQRLNGERLFPRTPVDRWLASSLAEELKRAGYKVTVEETEENALAKSPDFIITGEADEVWLAEVSITRYAGSIRASITLSDGKGRDITKNSYNSFYSKTVLPIYGVPQTLLNEALAEMLQPASRLLVQIMQ